MRALVPELAGVLRVARQPIHWFAPASHAEDFGREVSGDALGVCVPNRVFYTLPDFGDGVKAAVHYEGQAVDPDHVDRSDVDRRRLRG